MTKHNFPPIEQVPGMPSGDPNGFERAEKWDDQLRHWGMAPQEEHFPADVQANVLPGFRHLASDSHRAHDAAPTEPVGSEGSGHQTQPASAAEHSSARDPKWDERLKHWGMSP